MESPLTPVSNILHFQGFLSWHNSRGELLSLQRWNQGPEKLVPIVSRASHMQYQTTYYFLVLAIGPANSSAAFKIQWLSLTVSPFPLYLFLEVVFHASPFPLLWILAFPHRPQRHSVMVISEVLDQNILVPQSDSNKEKQHYHSRNPFKSNVRLPLCHRATLPLHLSHIVSYQKKKKK